MKKTKSYNLEESAIDVILEYKNQHGLKSVSAALENILLVEMPKAKQSADLEEIKEMIRNIEVVNVTKSKSEEKEIKEVEKKEEIINSNIKNSIASTFDCMPD